MIDMARRSIEADLVMVPWLLQNEFNSNSPLDADTVSNFRREAKLFSEFCSKSQINIQIPMNVEENVLEEAYYITVSSTALYLGYLRLGALSVNEEMFFVANRILKNFINSYGVTAFIELYSAQILYDNLNVISHYSKLDLKTFLSGRLHRPWSSQNLSKELNSLLNQNLVSITEDQHVILTTHGELVYQQILHAFKVSGLLSWRSRLIRLKKFNQMSDIEEILQILTPGSAEQRQLLITENKLAGLHVLELGCGSGALTFDSGLYKEVGEKGHLVASDPSVNMLAIAERKKNELGCTWVEIVHAQAEHIPYPENSFDCVIGCWFLHWTNIPDAISEIARVLKPGGVFSSVHALNYPAMKDFFIEWFEPLLLPKTTSQENTDSLPSPSTAPMELEKYFTQTVVRDFEFPTYYNSPHTVVNFHVEIANTFESRMELLPWGSHNELIENLIQRGERVVQKYTPEELIENHPAQFVWAIK